MPGDVVCSASSHCSKAAWSPKRWTGRSDGEVTGSSCFTGTTVGYRPGVGRERIPGPSAVWLVRHGESVGNLADAQAHDQGPGRLELHVRDPRVPPSENRRPPAPAPR